MRLLTFLRDGAPHLGALLGGWVVDLALADPALPNEMATLLHQGDSGLQKAKAVLDELRTNFAKEAALREQGGIVPLNTVRVLSPIPRPGKLIAVGLNFPAPDEDQPAPPYPIIFLKSGNTVSSDGAPIVIPPVTNEVHYEGELAVVIGRRGRNVSPEHAFNWVAGYTAANDVGAGDLERRSSQWASGKMLDTFTPLGPALVTRDEVPDPHALHIRTTLNGRVVQDGPVAEMIFNIPTLVSYLSTITTLEVGDVILTGSPKRNGDAPAPKIPLQAGDTVTVEIEGIGTLTNPVVAEEPPHG